MIFGIPVYKSKGFKTVVNPSYKEEVRAKLKPGGHKFDSKTKKYIEYRDFDNPSFIFNSHINNKTGSLYAASNHPTSKRVIREQQREIYDHGGPYKISPFELNYRSGIVKKLKNSRIKSK